jgi:DNA-binding transcriptional LysR family regulator
MYGPDITFAGVPRTTLEALAEAGLDAVLTEAFEIALDECDAAFLSVDVDVVDPGMAPGTGTPEPGGLTSRQLLDAVRRIAMEVPLAGIDVVEVAPPYDRRPGPPRPPPRVPALGGTQPVAMLPRPCRAGWIGPGSGPVNLGVRCHNRPGHRQAAPDELARFGSLGVLINNVYSRTMLDVTRLRVLVAVARHGSVTAAAHALNYAQPSVSHHLSRLEAETGTKLVQRAGRGIRLTDAGRLLAERSVEVIGRLDAAENELAVFAGLRAGRLRLAAFPSALSTIVPAAAAILHEQHPSVDLRLTEAEPPEALRMLRAGYVDVALIFRHEAADGSRPGAREAVPRRPDAAGEDEDPVATADHDDLREQVLLAEPVHLIMPDTAVCGGEPPLAPAVTELWPADLARLADYRWIAGCDRCREHLLLQCASAGFTPRISFTTDDFVAAQALVTAGLGVTLLPGLALRAARNPGVRTARLRGTRRCVVAVRYGEPPDPPATTVLLDALRVAAAGAPAGSEALPAETVAVAG